MECSVQPPPPPEMFMPDPATMGNGDTEMQGLAMEGQEVEQQQMPDQASYGLMRGQEGRQHTFVAQDGPKLHESIKDTVLPKESKSLNPKEQTEHLSFKESGVKVKELKVQPGEKPQFSNTQTQKQPSYVKTEQFVHKTLEQQPPPQSTKLPRSPLFDKNLQIKSDKKTQTSKQEKSETREKLTTGHNNATKENDKTDDREQKHKKKDQEEGFAEDQKDGNKDQNREQENDKAVKAEGIDPQEFLEYASQESIISQFFDVRVSQLDVFALFIEVLKLSLKGKEQERIGRRQERELQILHMENVCENYKNQGKNLLMSNVGAGVMAIFSGACPIAGSLWGDGIRDAIGNVFGKSDLSNRDFFRSASKLTYAMSEMGKAQGQIRNTFAEGNRTYDQHKTELHKADSDESTRSMEELKDHWKNIEQFLYQQLQMQHEAARQLYN